MSESVELFVFLATYSVLIVHALARTALLLPVSIQADLGPREGM